MNGNPRPEQKRQATLRQLNRLGKWRMLFAGWQLGTRSDTDAEAAAVRDHREVSLMLRVEANALVGLLIAKGVFSWEDWYDALGNEAVNMQRDLTERFPGVRATDDGLDMDVQQVAVWMRERNWRP